MSLASVRQVVVSICSLQPSRRLSRYGLWLLGLLCICLFFSVVSVLSIRYFFLPHIDNYRAAIEASLSRSTGLSVAIEQISADWQGWRPRLSLRNVAIRTDEGVSALSLKNIEAVIGWNSLFHFEPRLYRLEIISPALAVRRDSQGRLFVAGLEVKNTGASSGALDYVLEQSQIIVRDALVTWTDEKRAAPALMLERLNFRLDNHGTLHQFQLTATPPWNLANRIDIHGELGGPDMNTLSGQVYSEVDSVELPAWRTWVDYPVQLTNGKGSSQIRIDFVKSTIAGVTVDFSLSNLKAQLGPDLPATDLDSFTGKLKLTRLANGFEIDAQKIALRAHDGMRINPTDFQLHWQPLHGEFSTRSLELENLPYLASRIPIDARLRRRITSLAPVGRAENFKLTWNPEDSSFAHYRISGNFLGLGLSTQDPASQIAGLTGRIEGDENKGMVDIASTGLSVDLSVYFRQKLAFESLNAQMHWQRTGHALEINLVASDFKNRDLTGTVKASYVRQQPGEMGSIDLEANLTHLDAAAVWRYVPQQKGTQLSDWLHTALLAGESSDTVIKLKGDIAKLPFTKGSGLFSLSTTIHDGVLRYANDWPQANNLNGKITIDGSALAVAASSANIQGVAVSPVSVEIPDLDAQEKVLLINGKAMGMTNDFLKFIAISPLGESLGRLTRDITAKGNGELDLKLNIPLRNPDRTLVAGSYRFEGNNQLMKEGLPPLDDIQGHFEFTTNTWLAQGLRARFLGNQTRFDIKTETDDILAVKASGVLSMEQLQKYIPHPVFEYLSGQTRWSGSAKFSRKEGGAAIRISTDLQGLTSRLPEPFGKLATDSMSTVFESKSQPPPLVAGKIRTGMPATNLDQIDLSLGKILRAQLLLRSDSGKHKVERGFIGLGDVRLRNPERDGSMLTVNLPQIDADFWYALMTRGPKKPASLSSNDAEKNPLNLKKIDLKLGQAQAMGRVIHALYISGNVQNATWNADVSSQEIKGKVDWSDAGSGRLAGRFSLFNLPEPVANPAHASDPKQELPNIDLDFEHFVFEGRDFGRLKVLAASDGKDWNAKITGQNEDNTLSISTSSRLRQGTPQTDMSFRANIKNVEHYLDRIGYPNVVRQGNAVLAGNFRWSDVPYAFDLPSLSGTLSFEAKAGRFNKLKPGMGRLLGLLSLQTLPRRVALDFGDIFSEGFAFDSITGQVEISQGIITTKNLQILGPAAHVLLHGRLDLPNETQNIHVSVRPNFGESVTAGVALANPALGAATWALTKVMGNPLDKVVAFDYLVTGSVDNPKVEKLSHSFPLMGKEP